MSPTMWNALHAVELIGRVASRLEDGGGVVERYQLARLSVDELTLLVEQEAGLGWAEA